MKAWIFSDLHLEMDASFNELKIPDADVCLCAGDVLDGGVGSTIRWLRRFITPCMPVVFVPGDHEYYRSSINEVLAAGYELANGLDNIYLLDGDSISLNGFRFIGATLWTDVALHGDPRLPVATAKDQLNDYRRIKLSKTPFRCFLPQESRTLNMRATVDIDNAHRSQRDLPTVVVTHHAPSLASLSRELLKDPLTPTLASRFEHRILEYEPLLWVHGHIHSSSDYYIGKTRVICNPLGYPDDPSRKTFVPDLVVDLAKLPYR